MSMSATTELCSWSNWCKIVLRIPIEDNCPCAETGEWSVQCAETMVPLTCRTLQIGTQGCDVSYDSLFLSVQPTSGITGYNVIKMLKLSALSLPAGVWPSDHIVQISCTPFGCRNANPTLGHEKIWAVQLCGTLSASLYSHMYRLFQFSSLG